MCIGVVVSALGGLGYYFGIAVPAEKARQAQLAQAEVDANAAAAEEEKEKADAAAAELAAQQANADAEKAEQAVPAAQTSQAGAPANSGQQNTALEKTVEGYLWSWSESGKVQFYPDKTYIERGHGTFRGQWEVTAPYQISMTRGTIHSLIDFNATLTQFDGTRAGGNNKVTQVRGVRLGPVAPAAP